jgi:hypothetical protein
MTRQQALKRENSVEIFDEKACSDDECTTTDDRTDSNVAENEKEEEDEPLDLFDMQGFWLSHGRQRLQICVRSSPCRQP